MFNTDLNESLLKAVRKDRFKEIEKLVNKGADVNTFVDDNEKTILMQAAEDGRINIVRALIDMGADIDARNREENQTALFFACWEGCQDVAKLLIERGADVLHKKKGDRTTLMYAVHSNSLEVICILLEKGVKVNDANYIGLTALMYADDDDTRTDSIRILLQHGADINQKNSVGKTVLMRAVFYGSLKAAELLLENGADTNLISGEDFDIMSYAEDAEKNSREMIDLLKNNEIMNDITYYSYKIKMDCPDCGHPVLINGPMRQIKCSACSSKVQIEEDIWESIIESSTGAGGSSSIISRSNFKFEYKRFEPCCSGCNNKLDVGKVETGGTEPLVCEKCGVKNNTFSCPEWLSKFKVNDLHARQVFCAETEGFGDIVNEKQKIKPIAVNCVSCGAVLTIDTETPRNATCGHCDTVQYLPDGLFLALHPVKKIKKWYLRFGKE